VTPRRHDARYRQLLALAHEGDAAAASDLFHEFGVDPDHLPPLEEPTETNNTEET
jgi:hypothetical protein